jgi:hypothetical protein
MKPRLQIDPDGTKCWRLDGQLHCEDGPAVEYTSGSKAWYFHGAHHREDGPAVELADGSRYWYLNGVFHREDGPAIEYSTDRAGGSVKNIWFINGKRHREDGPAVERFDETKEWWLDDKQIAEGERPENWDELVLLYQIERMMNE